MKMALTFYSGYISFDKHGVWNERVDEDDED